MLTTGNWQTRFTFMMRYFLFGPTTARKEFRNYLLKEKLLPGKKISSRAADYLTDNQMVEQVRKYFKAV